MDNTQVGSAIPAEKESHFGPGNILNIKYARKKVIKQ